MRTITGGHRVRVAAAGLALALTAGGVSTALAVPVGPPPVVASAGAPAAAPAAPATTGDEGRRIVQAAPWPLSRADTDFYKMVLLPDGFPGVRGGGRVVAHPIYGVYLLRAFLRDYRRTHDVRDRRALAVLGQAVRARMRPLHGALVFWYDAATSVQLTKSGGRVYSALTQAYYMDVLSDVGVELHDAGLRSTAALAFRSLLVPTSEGGVRSPGTAGPVLEEEPTRLPSAILNGWLSALMSLRAYADRTHDPRAVSLLRASAREVARRLPRYDLPQVLGSAYASLAYLTLRFDVPVGTAVRSASLTLDGRTVPLRLSAAGRESDVVQLVRCGARRGGTVVATCAGLELDVPVTSGGVSGTSQLRLDLRGPGGQTVRGTVSRGTYRYVHDLGRSVTGWTGRRKVGASVRLPVTIAVVRDALVPTTFKHYGGHRVNSYHGIHVSRLTALADIGGPVFEAYARRWRAEMCRWAGHPAYRLIPRSDLRCPSGTAAAATVRSGEDEGSDPDPGDEQPGE